LLIAIREGEFHAAGSTQEFVALCERHYTYPSGHERTRRLLATRRAGFVTDFDVFSEEEMRTQPVFAELMRPLGFGNGIATAVDITGGDSVIFHMERGIEKGRYGDDIVGRLDRLRPHLARAAMISARLSLQRARTAVETLSALGMAACAVGRNGAVLVANAEFEAAVDYWTTRGGNRIALANRQADGLLDRALDALRNGAVVRSLPIPGDDGVAPAVLHVVPIRGAAEELFASATAILVLMKAFDTPANANPLLQVLFDLSPAEADVAARIAAGQTVEQIAGADGKSAHTVRNQLKSVLEKTATARQADLARLLAQLLPGPMPIDPGP
jgi:DNA-binding CsgD family transcriptional regulator